MSIRNVTLERLTTWAASELTCWGGDSRFILNSLHDQLHELSRTHPGIFIYRFGRNDVVLETKDSGNYAVDPPRDASYVMRAGYYLQLFEDVLRSFSIPENLVIAVDVDDHPFQHSEVPLFAFQKRKGDPLVLLPDIDMLEHNYYLSADFEDQVPPNEKLDKAFFVGSTTGRDITPEVVETLSLPRLRAAVFFRDRPKVVFRIANIVQYTDARVVKMIEDLGVTGQPAWWSEQFAYKYILSMDGNGATCSRVVIALRSRSALIKYVSDFHLYFFRGLESGREYIEVADDAQVLDVLRWGSEETSRVCQIVEQANAFCDAHLSRVAVLTYVDRLLTQYAEMIDGVGAVAPPETPLVIDLVGYFTNGHRQRSLANEWLGTQGPSPIPMCGFHLEPGPNLLASDLEYQTVVANGSLSVMSRAYGYCGGTDDAALKGLRIRMRGQAAESYKLTYTAAFADGSVVGPTPAGKVCRAPSNADLVAFKLTTKTRHAGTGGAIKSLLSIIRDMILGFSG